MGGRPSARVIGIGTVCAGHWAPGREGFVLREAQGGLERGRGKRSREGRGKGLCRQRVSKNGAVGVESAFGRLQAEQGGWDVAVAARDEAGRPAEAKVERP